jgi:hypothetical protein
MMHAGFATGTQPGQFIVRTIVPGTTPHHQCNFRHFSDAAEPIAAKRVSYRGTAVADKMQPRFDFPPIINPETFKWSSRRPTFHQSCR